jgi:hypothetical protein
LRLCLAAGVWRVVTSAARLINDVGETAFQDAEGFIPPSPLALGVR